MAFTIRGLNGMTDEIAQQRVRLAFSYLKRSELARFILEELENNADVCIDVDPMCEPFYAHPTSSYDTVTSGGTAVWNPNRSVQTTDSANWRGWDGGDGGDGKKTNPDAPWVPKHFERAQVTIQKHGLSKKISRLFNLSPTRTVTRRVRAKKFGTLSANMCLMHELGHAYQYAAYPEEYQNIKTWTRKDHAQTALETTNLQCVEIPIALELKALGADETPRWVYGHTGHQ
ncbi:MAG: hypothetical protein HKN49_11765 [Gammaproteobacteria bacterium]|nr:hypothetical protein [Gammaproteobacteria bacterium]